MIPILLHTNSDYFDILDLSLENIKKFGLDTSSLIVVSNTVHNDSSYDYHLYDDKEAYPTRLLNCIEDKKVGDTCILLHEDFILYDNVNMEELYKLNDFMKNNTEYDFIRFMKTAEPVDIPGPLEHLWFSNNQFAIQATLFKTDFLYNYLSKYETHTIWELEGEAQYNVSNGLYWYNGEPKRGSAHYDSSLFPCMATAVHKGKWNSEYAKELLAMKDSSFFTKRGWI